MQLDSLIPMLRQNGVTRFKGYGIEVDLSQLPEPVSHPVEPIQASAPPSIPEPTMDLPGTNDAMNYQSILNWSASPDAEGTVAPPLPLTGEGVE